LKPADCRQGLPDGHEFDGVVADVNPCRRRAIDVLAGRHHSEPQGLTVRRERLSQILHGDDDVVEACHNSFTHRIV